MELTEQFRQYAADALKHARESKSMATRREWLDIAGQWTALAKARMELLAVRTPGEGPEQSSKHH